jgi:3-dehydroquinate synthase class II
LRETAQSAQAGNEVRLDNGKLYDENGLIGAHVIICDDETQQQGFQYIGSCDWLLVECRTWSMIPLENLIASRESTPTRIAAVITTPVQAQGAGFALQQGVGALVVDDSPEPIEAALSVKSQRL